MAESDHWGPAEDRWGPAEAETAMEVEAQEVPWRPGPPPRRRWPMVLVVLVLLAGAAGAGAAAWLNYESGSGWRERARAEQARAEAAEERVEQLESDLARTAQLLGRSEEDVALLESRLAALASEKAGAEDSAALATGAAEELRELTEFAAEVGASLRDCIARTTSLTNDIIAAQGAGESDADGLNARIESVNQVCENAEGAYDELQGRLDALRG